MPGGAVYGQERRWLASVQYKQYVVGSTRSSLWLERLSSFYSGMLGLCDPAMIACAFSLRETLLRAHYPRLG